MNEEHSVSVNDELMAGEKLFPATPKRGKSKINKEAVAGTLFASIQLMGFLIFGATPLIMAFAMAFLDMHSFSFKDAKLVGPSIFENFKTVLTDDKFWDAIGNTLVFSISTFVCLILSLLIAYLLSKEIRGKKAFRIIYFIPYVCSAVAVILMWSFIFNPTYGMLNTILAEINPELAIKWTTDAGDFVALVLFISIWGGMGYSIILFTAALTNVNRATIEAATIDGAGAVSVFFNVVLPGISPTTFYLLVTGIIGALQSFATSQILSKDGGPDGVGITIVFYLYNEIFGPMNMGVASASAWILSIFILIATIINFVGSKKWVSYDQ